MGWGYGLHTGWATPQTAVPVYETLLEKAPKSSVSYSFLGTACCLAGQWQQAVTALDKSSNLPGGEGRPNAVFLAIAHQQLGNRPEAIRHYFRAVEWMAKTRLDVIGSRWNYLRKYYLGATQVLGVKAKGFKRDVPLTGSQISAVAVQTSSAGAGDSADNIANGAGLFDQDLDGLQEHDETAEAMWLSSEEDTAAWVEFDLAEVHDLGSILLWNYNETGRTQRGIKQADISVWTSQAGWQKVFDDIEFAEAEGSFDYDEPDQIILHGVRAQKVRLDDLVSFENDRHVGLSEIQFFNTRGPEAVRPYPPDGADIGTPPEVSLSWTPGIGVKAHRVYFGPDPVNLNDMGRFEVNGDYKVRLPELQKSQTYWWRIDAEKPGGSIVEGKLLSFLTGQLIGHWRFDRAEGDIAFDSSGRKMHGKLTGDSHIISDAEKGNVLSLDGEGDYVYIGNDSSLDLPNSMTLAAWIKANPSDELAYDIVSKGAGCWRLFQNVQTGRLEFYCCGLHVPKRDHYYTIFGRTNLIDGKWHHIACTYDGRSMTIYIDGRLERTAAASGVVNPRTWPVLIGASPSAIGSGCEFRGLIDDVRIYSYALNKEEIATLSVKHDSVQE
jgi:hypothetical protein